ncbi:MAG: hypothetical protein OEQ53_07335 [Saprospiraceae bacterium]|nr:hypothetical protein [Saprospiraceae bacterium]
MCRYCLKKSLLAAVLGICANMAYGQIISLPKTQRSVNTHQFYRFQAEQDDTYSIKIITPNGETIATPIKNKSMTLGGQVEFSFSTKYWKKGSYQIIAVGRRGARSTKRIKVLGTEK